MYDYITPPPPPIDAVATVLVVLPTSSEMPQNHNLFTPDVCAGILVIGLCLFFMIT